MTRHHALRCLALGVALALGLVAGALSLAPAGAPAAAHHAPGHGGGPGGGGGGGGPTPTPAPCTSCPTLHVAVTNVNAYQQPGYIGAVCLVEVRDGAGALVEGARVDVAWSGAFSGTQSGLTEDQGGTVFASLRTPDIGGKCKRRDPQCFTCRVVHVSKDGYGYAPEQNVQDTDQDSCDPFSSGCG